VRHEVRLAGPGPGCRLAEARERGLDGGRVTLGARPLELVKRLVGLAQTLLEEFGTALEGTGRGYAARIEQSARSMDRLLLDLLDFSRLSNAAMPLESVNLGNLITEVLRECETDIHENQARVELVTSLPSVRAHASTLGQVLTNLFTNAMKFVAPGVQPFLRIRAEERKEGIDGLVDKGMNAGQPSTNPSIRSSIHPPPPATWVRIWVEDNGIGIPAEFQERIFHVFERLNGAAYPGTGIGLTIVRKGAERMGGRAGVESAPGEGSRFWIELGKARQDEGIASS
jgi:signal transduction histidine kinase